MASYLLGHPMWEDGHDSQYLCKVCGKGTWYDTYEYKRMVDEYGYDGITCSEECKNAPHQYPEEK